MFNLNLFKPATTGKMRARVEFKKAVVPGRYNLVVTACSRWRTRRMGGGIKRIECGM